MTRWFRDLVVFQPAHRMQVCDQFAALKRLPEADRMRTKQDVRWPIGTMRSIEDWKRKYAA